MKVMKSAEDYLENILILQRKNGRVRSIDIVHSMDFSKPSISIAMKNLKELNLINMDKDGIITLTPAGEEIALEVYNRHCTIKNFFVKIGVPENIAEEDACKIEHDISKESIAALKNFIDQMGN